MKTLCLYTNQFPYGLGEQFIETEIKYLCKAFDKVYILPNSSEGTRREIPQNAEVLTLKIDGYTTKEGLKALGLWSFSCIGEVFKNHNKKYAISDILRIGYKAELLYSLLKEKDLLSNSLHYSYWLEDWATTLSVLKAKKKIKGYISRAHRFDLYEEISRLGYIPYRKLQLKNLDYLYLISEDGLDYMIEKYPQYKEKYKLSYLGVENDSEPNFNYSVKDEYTVVSCSRVVEVKRIDLISKALSQITDKKINWIHFGYGPLFDEVKKHAEANLPENVTYNFRGMVPNSEVLEFYKNNFVDCLINVSSSEGLPVSIMEAVSFGIPIVATDVGGTSEIINPQTGVLLSENPEITEIKDGIVEVLNGYSKNPSKRASVRDYWLNHFDAKVNYETFVSEIVEYN